LAKVKKTFDFEFKKMDLRQVISALAELEGKKVPVKAEPKREKSPEKTKSRPLKENAALVVLLIIAACGAVLLYWHRERGRAPSVGKEPGNVESELMKLKNEKDEIEGLIDLAKEKYHMRKIDQESFREIVRDHQKKLIEIESKMSRIEARINRLELQNT